MIVTCAWLFFGVLLFVWGAARWRVLDVEHRSDRNYDPDFVLPYVGVAVAVALGVTLLALAISSLRSTCN